MTITHPFPPIFDEHSEILILGSFPSVKSRENNFYYAHPLNRFWRVLAAIFNTDIPETVTEKTDFLLTRHIALWDVIRSCEIVGSADAKIKNPTINDIAGLVSKTRISGIFCNGAVAFNLYEKYVKNVPITAVKLPSTSPANAAYSLDRLITAYRTAFVTPSR
jgi:hypoxanthine-DNA glycosylase